MLLDNNLVEAEVPAVLRRLWHIAPFKLWSNRVDDLALRERKNRHLRPYFEERFAIERGILSAVYHKRATGRFPTIGDSLTMQCYEALSFASTIVRVFPRISRVGQNRLRGSLLDGLKSGDGLVSLNLEMSTAAHLWSVGFDVEFSDLEDAARFDFLAAKDGLELEIECRAVTADGGRPIHRLRFLELVGAIENQLVSTLRARKSGLALRIVLPGALHGNEAPLAAIRAAVLLAAKERRSVTEGQFAIFVHEFPLVDREFEQSAAPSEDFLRSFVSRHGGNPNVDAVCFHTPHHGAIIVTVESRQETRVIEYTYRHLKKKSATQFSRNRPAILVVQLTDLRKWDVELLGKQRDSGFWQIAHRLFEGKEREHLVSLAYVAPSRALTRKYGPSGASYRDVGSVFAINNPWHPLADDPRISLTGAS